MDSNLKQSNFIIKKTFKFHQRQLNLFRPLLLTNQDIFFIIIHMLTYSPLHITSQMNSLNLPYNHHSVRSVRFNMKFNEKNKGMKEWKLFRLEINLTFALFFHSLSMTMKVHHFMFNHQIPKQNNDSNKYFF